MVGFVHELHRRFQVRNLFTDMKRFRPSHTYNTSTESFEYRCGVGSVILSGGGELAEERRLSHQMERSTLVALSGILGNATACQPHTSHRRITFCVASAPYCCHLPHFSVHDQGHVACDSGCVRCAVVVAGSRRSDVWSSQKLEYSVLRTTTENACSIQTFL